MNNLSPSINDFRRMSWTPRVKNAISDRRHRSATTSADAAIPQMGVEGACTDFLGSFSSENKMDVWDGLSAREFFGV